MIRATVKAPNVFVGSSTLYKDETAFIVECGDISCMELFQDLCQEIVIISNRKVLVTSLYPKEVWEPRVTQCMVGSPLSAIGSIKFRSSLGLKNNLWLKPAVTDTQINADRQKVLIARKPAAEREKVSMQVQLKIEGLPHVRHEEVCNTLMGNIGEVTKIPLNRGGGLVPGPSEWIPSYRNDGSFAQQILVQLPTEQAVLHLIQCVHGRGIKINGVCLSVDVKRIGVADASQGVHAQNFICEPGGGQCL